MDVGQIVVSRAGNLQLCRTDIAPTDRVLWLTFDERKLRVICVVLARSRYHQLALALRERAPGGQSETESLAAAFDGSGTDSVGLHSGRGHLSHIQTWPLRSAEPIGGQLVVGRAVAPLLLGVIVGRGRADRQVDEASSSG